MADLAQVFGGMSPYEVLGLAEKGVESTTEDIKKVRVVQHALYVASMWRRRLEVPSATPTPARLCIHGLLPDAGIPQNGAGKAS